MDLGNTIKELRLQKGYKQNVFAQLCDISQTYLSQIEGNQKEPNISTLKIISDNLNVPLPLLFFLSLDEDDIPGNKKKSFKLVGPIIKSLINDFLND